MYLVDTNVWLEPLLQQERAEEAVQFLTQTPTENLFITDFSFYSIGILLTRRNRPNILLDFVQDVFTNGAVVLLVRLEPQDTPDIVAAINQFNLDFDDAYQYVAAQRNNLIIVSFDNDFNRTPEGRRTPAEIIV
jgi:predicted nucleic acid-binding protein